MYKLLIVSGIFILFSCKKNESTPINYYYNFFPNDIGRYVIYKVSDYNYTTIGNDSSFYYIKEKITANFVDDQGNLSQRLERYKADSLNGQFLISDVWVVTKTKTDAEKVEENIRYVKLDFPIKSDVFWDGNSFNSLSEATYSYDSLFIVREINNLVFDSTVKVVQKDNYNAVEYQQWYEIYAANIGMIYKEYIDLSINQFDINNINQGKKLKMSVVAYGKE